MNENKIDSFIIDLIYEPIEMYVSITNDHWTSHIPYIEIALNKAIMTNRTIIDPNTRALPPEVIPSVPYPAQNSYPYFNCAKSFSQRQGLENHLISQSSCLSIRSPEFINYLDQCSRPFCTRCSKFSCSKRARNCFTPNNEPLLLRLIPPPIVHASPLLTEDQKVTVDMLLDVMKLNIPIIQHVPDFLRYTIRGLHEVTMKKIIQIPSSIDAHARNRIFSKHLLQQMKDEKSHK